MPTIPLISPQVPESSGGSYAKVTPQLLTPTLQRPVRANPGMYEGVNQANQSIAQGLSNIGQGMMEVEQNKLHLQQRTKIAADDGYITGSDTEYRRTGRALEDFALNNGDPSTWGEEVNARLAETKEKVMEGAKGLGPMAQNELKLKVEAWEEDIRGRMQIAATRKNAENMHGAFNTFVQEAVQDGDIASIENEAAKFVGKGYINATTGQSVVAKARRDIQQNVINGMMQEEPFLLEKKLTEKDAEGHHVLFPEMPDTLRTTLLFRAHKAAAQTRSNSMREWSSMMRDALDGKGPMPDKDGIMEDAKEQGISPKWVDNLFKPPAGFDQQAYQSAMTELSSLDLVNDPTFANNARAMAIVTSFTGDAASRLNELMKRKADPKDALTSSLAKFGEHSIKDMFENGGYGRYKDPAGYDKEGNRVPGAENPGAKMKAEIVMANNLTLFHDWVKKHPEATPLEAQKFINSLNSQHATSSASNFILRGGALGLPAK